MFRRIVHKIHTTYKKIITMKTYLTPLKKVNNIVVVVIVIVGFMDFDMFLNIIIIVVYLLC